MWPFKKDNEKNTRGQVPAITPVLSLPLGRFHTVSVWCNRDPHGEMTIPEGRWSVSVTDNRTQVSEYLRLLYPPVRTDDSGAYPPSASESLGRARDIRRILKCTGGIIRVARDPNNTVTMSGGVGNPFREVNSILITIPEDPEDLWMVYAFWRSRLYLTPNDVIRDKDGAAINMAAAVQDGATLSACVGDLAQYREAFLAQYHTGTQSFEDPMLFLHVFPMLRRWLGDDLLDYVEFFDNAFDRKTYARCRTDSAQGYAYTYHNEHEECRFVPLDIHVIPECQAIVLLVNDVRNTLLDLRSGSYNLYSTDMKEKLIIKLENLLIEAAAAVSDLSPLPDIIRRMRSAVDAIPAGEVYLEDILRTF